MDSNVWRKAFSVGRKALGDILLFSTFLAAWIGTKGYNYSRPLYDNDIALAKTIFDDCLDYDDVRVRSFTVPFVRKNFCIQNSFFRVVSFRDKDPLRSYIRNTTLIHELTHIWQHQSGKSLVAEACALKMHYGDYDNAYDYVLDMNSVFKNFNIEQQADFLSDYFRLRSARDSLKVGGDPYISPKYKHLYYSEVVDTQTMVKHRRYNFHPIDSVLNLMEEIVSPHLPLNAAPQEL